MPIAVNGLKSPIVNTRPSSVQHNLLMIYFVFQIHILFIIIMLMIILCLIPIKILIFSSTTCNMTVSQFFVGLRIILCRPIHIKFKELVPAERVTI